MKIVILTGAGVSAESGLSTFRDKGGIWTKFDLNEVATPEGFARDPEKVHDFYNSRRINALGVEPNAAHLALARLQARFPGEVVIVTQNVDNLHETAGARTIHMHGRLDMARCADCAACWKAPLEMSVSDPCPECGKAATRPDIVWFGEVPQALEEIGEHLERADLFAAIGTSGQVYPAAGFVREARRAGAATIEINLERTGAAKLFDAHLEGRATETVPLWVEELLKDAAV